MAAFPQVEGYENNAITAVASGGYTSGSGVLNVDSTASPFPTDRQFHLVVQDPSTFAVKVILRVTGSNSGTQWTVAAEGSDANALEDDVVTLMLTKGAFDQIRQDMSGYGTYANRPSSALMKKGARYYPTDKMWTCIHDGSAWVDLYDGVPIVVPAAADFTYQVNTSTTSTKSDTGSGLKIVKGYQNGYVRLTHNTSPPSAPYTLEVAFIPKLANSNFNGTGPLLWEFNATPSNAKYESFLYAVNGGSLAGAVDWNKYTGGSYTATYGTNMTVGAPRVPIWLRIVNDNTDLKGYYSPDSGRNWFLLSTHSKTSFLATIDSFGWFIEQEANSSGDAQCGVSGLFHWKVS